VTLRRRVAMASALAAALGGAFATLVAGALSQNFVTRHENERLAAAAALLASEVEEEMSDEDDDDDFVEVPRTLEAALWHELDDDIRIPGARALISGNGPPIGDLALDALMPHTCAERDIGRSALRLCSVPFRDGVLTLAVDDARAREQRAIFWWALVVGLAAGAMMGGAASLWVATWSLRPLSRFRERVEGIDPSNPASSDLGPPASEIEVESLRRSLVDLLRRLGESLTVARAFAADASHELRTPLSTIGAELELLEETAIESDRAALQRARRRVLHLSALVERLLVLARPEGERASDAVEIPEIIEDARRALAPTDRARVSIEAPDELTVRGDATLLRAMIGNALDNALKFSWGPVSCVARADGSDVLIEVSDEGPGVPPADRARVFEPFVRGTRSRPGHGIGLALIDRVARSHGGRARFGDADVGARLEVRLPAWSARA
jgi:signal transduction histidine kinase